MKWKPIYDGLYLLSDEGKVFSARSGKLIRTSFTKEGYERVEINIGGVPYRHFVHRLVAENFIPNPDNLPVVNHKDENPANNCVDNLEWCTQKYNINYGTCIERRVAHTEYKSGGDNVRAKKVYRFDLNGNFISEYDSVAEAADATGLNRKSISKACTGGLKKYAECVWSYNKQFSYDDHRHYENRNGTVCMYDLSGNLIKEYNSPDEMRADGLDPRNVNRVCRGERKTYNNFIFTRKADT